MQDNRCTGFPNGNWLECCQAHDYSVADAECQKSSPMRLKADQELRRCVSAKGHPCIALLMYAAIRVYANIKGGY